MDILGKPVVSKPIAVLQGAESDVIQRLLAECAADWAQRARVVGVVEDGLDGARLCRTLRNLAGGRSYPVFQDLGSGSSGCSLDGPALVAAGEQVRHDIAAGCDLVVLSKFGKFEAENGSGLLPAFSEALEAGAAVLTSVAPKFMPAWNQFADPFYEIVPAERTEVDAWWARAFQTMVAGEK